MRDDLSAFRGIAFAAAWGAVALIFFASLVAALVRLL